MNVRLRFLMMLAVLLSFSLTLHAQTPAPEPTIYWKFISEQSSVDFFYRVADCGNSKHLYLRVKNDTGKERLIAFTIEISGAGKISKEITLHAAPVAILEPDCADQDKNKMLRIELPPPFDASLLEVKIKLHE